MIKDLFIYILINIRTLKIIIILSSCLEIINYCFFYFYNNNSLKHDK